MKLSTVTYESIEMTHTERSKLVEEYYGNISLPIVCGKKVLSWDREDGRDEILLEGETVYRVVVIKN